MAILCLCFLYLSLTILPEKLSERAVQTEKGGKGDEKAKEWDREKGREREKDPFDVLCYNTSQSQLKGFVKNAWHAHN